MISNNSHALSMPYVTDSLCTFCHLISAMLCEVETNYYSHFTTEEAELREDK